MDTHREIIIQYVSNIEILWALEQWNHHKFALQTAEYIL